MRDSIIRVADVHGLPTGRGTPLLTQIIALSTASAIASAATIATATFVATPFVTTTIGVPLPILILIEVLLLFLIYLSLILGLLALGRSAPGLITIPTSIVRRRHMSSRSHSKPLIAPRQI